jgi:cardiolipin synthase
MVPAFILALVYWTPERTYLKSLALSIFLTACLTDALDGWIARRTGQKTRLGSLMDPMADKILLTSAYLAFAWLPGLPDAARVPAWLTVIVVSRDLILVTGAAMIFMMQNRFDAATNFLGKITTVLQMLLVLGVLAGVPSEILQGLVFAVAAATVLSGAVYLKAGIAKLGGGTERA